MRYACSKCGKSGCKLWRQYQTVVSAIDLLCLECAEADQGKRLEDGDQIGWLVPAVPTPLPSANGEMAVDGTFWGYTSVPLRDVKWWYSLGGRPHKIITDEQVAEAEAYDKKRREDAASRQAALIRDAQYLVEADSFAQQALWERWHERVSSWVQEVGFWEQIGEIVGKPVCVAVAFNRIGGKVVAFYEATSRMVDHDMVEAWVARTFPASRGNCSAMNFHQCVDKIGAWRHRRG